ncbi:uncharacterized protein LOC134814191 [Bolinopsis microptera]|uniref:uncharacterized protein LOC134814191 n=1 Tax=Bolinopsis microptera TaxID=2820187 RepID=UPI0030794FD0
MKDRALEEKEAHERRGLENPCRQRTKKMWVSQEEMHRQKVPLYYRDYCAHWFIPWRNCLVDNNWTRKAHKTVCHRWKEGWDQCQIRDNLDRVAEKKCLKKEGLWRKVPFSAEIFDNKRDKLMANDSGWQFGYDIRGRPIRRRMAEAQVEV